MELLSIATVQNNRQAVYYDPKKPLRLATMMVDLWATFLLPEVKQGGCVAYPGGQAIIGMSMCNPNGTANSCEALEVEGMPFRCYTFFPCNPSDIIKTLGIDPAIMDDKVFKPVATGTGDTFFATVYAACDAPKPEPAPVLKVVDKGDTPQESP